MTAMATTGPRPEWQAGIDLLDSLDEQITALTASLRDAGKEAALRSETDAVIGHKMRTALTVIAGVLDTVLAFPDDQATARDLLARAAVHTQALERLTTDLLSAHHDAKLVLTRAGLRTVSLRQVAEEAMACLEPGLEAGVDLDGVDVAVVTSPERLKSMLANVFGYAARRAAGAAIACRADILADSFVITVGPIHGRTDPDQGENVGLRLVRLLARSLGGVARLVGEPDGTVVASIELPQRRGGDPGSSARRAATMESVLRRAIDDGDIGVHYQPEIDLASSRVVGAEALARWQHPERGLILPAEFIPLAEESGLIGALGARVLEIACREGAAWRRPRTAEPVVSVNLSAAQLLDRRLLGEITAILERSGLAPASLCIEITESVLLADTGAAAAALAALKDLGLRIAVDDFGTGYCSLLYLKRLPVDVLKIDRSFVSGLGHGCRDRAIVSSVIDLAHAFGISTTAEGIETPDQLAVLRQLGCERGQGFYWSPALPSSELNAWIAERPEPMDPADAEPQAYQYRLLVIDDDRSLRRVVRLALPPDAAVDVREAADGREGVAMARRYQPDVVLLDLAMPGMGGLEALPLIRAVARRCKVVVLSAVDAPEMAKRAREEGAVAFLRKDVDLCDLSDHLGMLLSQGIPS